MDIREQLSSKFEEFKKIPFPSFPMDLESVADLALADSNLAGSINSYLSGSILKPEEEDLSEVKASIESYKYKNDEEQQMIEEINEYIKAMNELNRILGLINKSS